RSCKNRRRTSVFDRSQNQRKHKPALTNPDSALIAQHSLLSTQHWSILCTITMLQVTSRTSEMLEWPEFLHFFSRFVTSPAAQSFVSKIVPVENLQAELDVSREVLACDQKESLPSFGAVEDISELLKKTAIQNQIMEGIELIRIARLAAQNNRVRNETRG